LLFLQIVYLNKLAVLHNFVFLQFFFCFSNFLPGGYAGHYITLYSFLCEIACHYRPLWTDTHPSNIVSQWQDEWKLASVAKSSLPDDPTIWQPGFNQSRCCWALLNSFQTNQGHCASCQKKRNLAATDMCPCGKCQTMSHIVSSCPQSMLELQRLYSADDVGTLWLKRYGL